MQVSRNVYWLKGPDQPNFHLLRPWCTAHHADLRADALSVLSKAGKVTAAFNLMNASRSYIAFWIRIQVVRQQAHSFLGSKGKGQR